MLFLVLFDQDEGFYFAQNAKYVHSEIRQATTNLSHEFFCLSGRYEPEPT